VKHAPGLAALPRQRPRTGKPLVPVAAGHGASGPPTSPTRSMAGTTNTAARSAVSAFEASRYLTSNGEFRDFVEDNGYSRPEFWDDEGRGWLHLHRRRGTPGPSGCAGRRLAVAADDRRSADALGLAGGSELSGSAAFCRWKAATHRPAGAAAHRGRMAAPVRRLRSGRCTGRPPGGRQPASGSWRVVVSGRTVCPRRLLSMSPAMSGNGRKRRSTPSTVSRCIRGTTTFSTPTFDDRHNLIKGGSWIACGNESRARSRYAFRRHFFQHAGFRYVSEPHPHSAECLVRNRPACCRNMPNSITATSIRRAEFLEGLAQSVHRSHG
jgi:hypothetical protein